MATAGGTTNQSICPKNWTLPTYTIFKQLVTAYDYQQDKTYKNQYNATSDSSALNSALAPFYAAAESVTTLSGVNIIFTGDHFWAFHGAIRTFNSVSSGSESNVEFQSQEGGATYYSVRCLAR